MRTLDLHGFNSTDAIDALDAFLYSFSQSGESRARIMTGKGLGKIQKVVISYLKKAGYKWQYEKMSNGKENTGVLIVF